jgi:nitroreductase
VRGEPHHHLLTALAVSSTAGGLEHDALRRLVGRRHSCRAFGPEPVPEMVLQQLLEVARMAPSWCNTQPWSVVITRGAATERLRAALTAGSRPEPVRADYDLPASYSGAHLDRRRECGWQLYEAVGVERGDREASARETQRNFELFGAPHLAVLAAPAELGTYGALDVGVYLAHFLIAAESLGVAAVAQAAIATRADVVRVHLGLADDVRVVCGISFGYALEEHPANGFRTRRAPLSETVTFVD